LDETTGAIGAQTAKGAPVVTRARLVQALKTHGKNDFGETLDYPQKNVVDQVLEDLHASEVLGRAKKVVTGGGGSQTAPLLSLMAKSGTSPVGGRLWLDLTKAMGNYSRKKQQLLLNQILLKPEDALLVMRQAEKLKRPFTTKEKVLLQGVRAVLSSPSYAALGKGADEQTDEVGK
jgi:hypothetical protein